MSENYLIYPTKVMKITQNHTQGNHAGNSGGKPWDFPVDEACEDTGRSLFYCPCDAMKVVRVYGVGSVGTNTIWLESVSPVDMPCGRDQITIMVMHPNDDDLEKIKVGQVFRRGQPMFREGTDGNATGNHFHMAVGTGTINGNGWASNGKAWVLTVSGKVLKANEAFFVDENTKILKSGGYDWKMATNNYAKKVDNTPDKYAKEAVEWAIKNKILQGSDGDYMLHSPVTRQDLLVFLYRTLH